MAMDGSHHHQAADQRLRRESLDHLVAGHLFLIRALRDRGVPSEEDLHAVTFPDVMCEVNWYANGRPESAEELAQMAATGEITPTDERLRGLSALAAGLRTAAAQAEYFGHTEVAGDRRLESIAFAGVLRYVKDYVETFWQTPRTHLVVIQDREQGARRRLWPRKREWRFNVYTSDHTGTIGEPVGSGAGYEPSEAEATRTAIAELPIELGDA